MDKSLASLEVLFWLKPKGIKEKELLTLLEIEKKDDLLTTLNFLQNHWKEDPSRGFFLKNEGSLWFLEPKDEYVFWLEKMGKSKKIPLDQREIIALLFYEEGLGCKEINEKRGKTNSYLALSRLISSELIEKKGESFFLTEKCKSLFLDQENKKRMDK